MYHTSICCFHKDENKYLIEWIRYHRSIGFEHIYLLDNGSAESPHKQLAEEIDNGFVTLLDYSHYSMRLKQVKAFEHFIDNFRSKSHWCAFIDTDEFIVLKDTTNIASFLASYENAGGVAMHWRCFGSNGHLTPPEAGVLASYTRSTEPHHKLNRHIKTIARLNKIKKVHANPHNFTFQHGFFCVNENNERVKGRYKNAIIKNISSERIQINHYWTRSRHDFAEKISRGGGNGRGYSWKEFDRYEKTANSIEDLSALTLCNNLSCQRTGKKQ